MNRVDSFIAAGPPLNAVDPIVVAFITFIALGVTSGLLGLAWPSMQRRFGLPLDAVGLIYAASTIAYLAVSVTIGRLMRGLGGGTVLFLGAMLLLSAMVGTALAPAWGLVIFFSALNGLGSGILDAGLNLHLATYHAARHMNWLHACFGVGVTVGPLVMTFGIRRGFGWHFGYLVAGALMVLPVTLISLTRSQWRGGASDVDADLSPSESFVDSLREPSVWLGVALFTACVGLEIAVGQWAYVLLTQSRGLPEATAGILVGAHWAALTGGRFFFGFVAEHVGAERLLGVLMPTLAAATAFFWWNPTPVVGVTALLLIGFAEAPIFPMLMSDTRRRVGAAHAENAVALQMFGSGVASALAPGLIGVIGRRLGLEAMSGAFLLFSIIALACHAMMRSQAARSSGLSIEQITKV